MGRQRMISNGGKTPYCKNPDVLKSRHRSSDTKYRLNVQFLHELLKEDTKENLTKDNLLNVVAENIEKMQEDIVLLAGPQKLEKCNGQFLKLVKLSEDVWKKEKTLAVWWSEMQQILNYIMNDELSNSALDISKFLKNFLKP